jgi:L-asparaginase / beta-aspartyl-peptidase
VDLVVQEQLTSIEGDGGVIAVSRDGEIGWSFNTLGMYRARISAADDLVVGIYKDDP